MSDVISPLISENLAISGVRHGFFTRKGGVSAGLYASLNLGVGSNDDPTAVRENRRRVADWFGAPTTDLIIGRQVHSARVAVAEAAALEGRTEADGVAASTVGLICAVLIADCAPVLLADPDARVVAAAHAGWKGALGGVLEAAVATMVEKGAEPRRIIAAVGPCIGPASYEVGLEFLDKFLSDDPDSQSFFEAGASPEKRLFNLPGYVLSRLRRAGVSSAEWIGRDTVMEPDMFFSNRRAFKSGEGDYGRLVAAIALT
jgi:YfiH family protein